MERSKRGHIASNTVVLFPRTHSDISLRQINQQECFSADGRSRCCCSNEKSYHIDSKEWIISQSKNKGRRIAVHHEKVDYSQDKRNTGRLRWLLEPKSDVAPLLELVVSMQIISAFIFSWRVKRTDHRGHLDTSDFSTFPPVLAPPNYQESDHDEKN